MKINIKLKFPFLQKFTTAKPKFLAFAKMFLPTKVYSFEVLNYPAKKFSSLASEGMIV